MIVCSLSIVIAEDDATSYALFEEMLDGMNINFYHAKNGREAFEFVKENPDIDLILMDIKMTVMDGYEATKMIKSNFPEIPVVAQTAYASPQDREKALKVGCDSYISKPIQEKDFLNVINKLLMKGKMAVK